MKRPQKSTVKKSNHRAARKLKWLIPIMAVLAFFVIASGGFLFAAHTEENDAFCASCHTQPESTFYQRTQATAVDLASSHHAKNTPVKCIDCHSAPGLGGRVDAVSLGARDAIKWVAGSAVQPAPLTVPISDTNCLVCHADTPKTRSFDSHFHFFLTRWQKADPSAATCVSCHSAHTTDGDASIGYLQEQRTVQQCQACHRALGEG